MENVENIRSRIVKVRQRALHAECAAMASSSMVEAIEFEKIGKELDRILKFLDQIKTMEK